MLKFVVWYIIGTFVLAVFNGVFVVAWATIRKVPDELTKEFMSKARGKANYPLSRFNSRAAQAVMSILMAPVCDIVAVIYMIQLIDAYAKSNKETS